MRLRVVCGLGVTMETLRPTRVLTSVDLPALGRPTMATNPDLNGMRHRFYAHGSGWGELEFGGQGARKIGLKMPQSSKRRALT